jgi:5-methylthioadenosine/S-adenosylhomocysteine deaminase
MILTLDVAGTYFERGTLVIEGDRIVSVDDGTAQVTEKPGDETIDASGKIVMPGLVDLHYHTALGKGYNDHLPLWEYLDECWYPIVRAVDPEAAYWAALVSYTESIKAGVTTVNDMYRQLGALAQAAGDIGIRAVLSSDAALPEHGLDTLADNAGAYAANHGKSGGRIEVWVGIDWLPTVDMAFLRDARSLADELRTGVHIHLGESMSEVGDSLERFGMRPAHVYHQAGLLGPDVVAAHSVCLDDSEIRLLAETGAHVSHNPSSNAKLGNGIRGYGNAEVRHQCGTRPRCMRMQQQRRYVRGHEVRLPARQMVEASLCLRRRSQWRPTPARGRWATRPADCNPVRGRRHPH